ISAARVPFAPELCPSRNIDQLRFNSQIAAMLSHPSCEYCINMEITSCPLWVVLSRFVSRYRTSSHNGEIGKSGKRVCDLFRHCFAEIVHFRIVVRISKRQDCDGADSRGSRGTRNKRMPCQKCRTDNYDHRCNRGENQDESS